MWKLFKSQLCAASLWFGASKVVEPRLETPQDVLSTPPWGRFFVLHCQSKPL